MSIKILLYFTLLLCFSISSAFAQSQTRCREKKRFQSKISIELENNGTTYNYSKSAGALKKEAKRYGRMKLKKRRWHDLEKRGAAYSQTEIDIDGSTRYVALRYDKYGVYLCPFVEKVHLTASIDNKINIANKYEKGTCKFNTLLKRQQENARRNEKIVVKALAKLKTDMPTIIAMSEDTYIDRSVVDSGFQILIDKIDDAMDVYLSYMMDDIKKQSKEAKANYISVDKVCRK